MQKLHDCRTKHREILLVKLWERENVDHVTKQYDIFIYGSKALISHQYFVIQRRLSLEARYRRDEAVRS